MTLGRPSEIVLCRAVDPTVPEIGLGVGFSRRVFREDTDDSFANNLLDREPDGVMNVAGKGGRGVVADGEEGPAIGVFGRAPVPPIDGVSRLVSPDLTDADLRDLVSVSSPVSDFCFCIKATLAREVAVSITKGRTGCLPLRMVLNTPGEEADEPSLVILPGTGEGATFAVGAIAARAELEDADPEMSRVRAEGTGFVVMEAAVPEALPDEAPDKVGVRGAEDVEGRVTGPFGDA